MKSLNSKDQRSLTLKWIESWREAAPELEILRREKIRQANTTQSILNLEDAFQSAILKGSSKPYSGLVEQQKLFMELLQRSIT